MNYYSVSVRLNEDEKSMLTEFAKEHDLTMSQVLRKALKAYIEQNGTICSEK